MGACYSKSAHEQNNTPKTKKPHKGKKQKNGLAVTVENSPNEQGEDKLSEVGGGAEDNVVKEKEEGEKSVSQTAVLGSDDQQEDKRDNSSSGPLVDADDVFVEEKEDHECRKTLTDNEEHGTSVDSGHKKEVTSQTTTPNGCPSSPSVNVSVKPKTAIAKSSNTGSVSSSVRNGTDTEKSQVHEHDCALSDPKCACCRLSTQDSVVSVSDSTPPVSPLHKSAGYLRQHSLNLDHSNHDNSGSKRSSRELRAFESTTSLDLASAFQSLQDVKTMQLDGKEVVVIDRDVYVQIMDELGMLKQKLSLLTEIINEQEILVSDTSRDRSSVFQD